MNKTNVDIYMKSGSVISVEVSRLSVKRNLHGDITNMSWATTPSSDNVIYLDINHVEAVVQTGDIDTDGDVV